MDRRRLRTGALLLLLASGACRTAEAPWHPVSGAASAWRLFAPIHFYQGYTVGRGDRSTGLKVSADSGRSFTSPTWPELITSSVSVDASGRFLFLACGNGVMISRDGGQNWRLTGGWEVTEVQRVAIDRRDPRRAWAATAYGIARTSDATASGNVWEAPSPDGVFRFAHDVIQDARAADTLWVGAHRGLFVSRDGGTTFLPVQTDAPALRVWQSPTDPDRLLVATDGSGLLRSTDAGQSFARLPGPPDVVFSIAQRPGWLAAGTKDGLWSSVDEGRTWTRGEQGLPQGFFVYGIAFDPETPDRVVVSGNKGVFESVDRGRTFAPLAFEGAIVPDVSFARVADVPPLPPSGVPGELALPGPAGRPTLTLPDPDTGFETRRAALLDRLRAQQRSAPAAQGWFQRALAVQDGHTEHGFWDEVRDALADPGHSMFSALQIMAFQLHARDALPPDVARRIREVMTRNAFYRGDTENHRMLHYAALLLATETWPETPAATWYAGRSTQRLHDEAKGSLLRWARLTARRGQGEFDSPHYVFMYLAPLFLLHDFSRDPEVRQAARMALDLLLADYLVESLQGAWCGAHSRTIGAEVERTRSNSVSALHYLYAGGIALPERIHAWMIPAALSTYRPPTMLSALANRRERPFVHTELKRVRNVMRFGAALSPPVRKYDYMTPLYGMGSIQGGILQPIQQHTWDVTWTGSAENSTFFTVQPSMSARELAMFFPEEIHDIANTISAQKGSYADPAKLVSASPWERVFQHENVLLALYAVPPGERFPRVNMYVPDCLATTEQDGWLFGHDGEFWLACFRTAAGAWERREGARVEVLPATATGIVVVTRPMDRTQTFEGFRDGILALVKPTLTIGVSGPAIALEGPDGRHYSLDFRDGRGRIDGAPAPYPEDALFSGPFLSGAVDSGVIRMTDGTATRTLDFNTLTVSEERP